VIYIASAAPKYHVIIGARNLSKGETVLKDVQAKSGIQGTISIIQLDLINNAGICPEKAENIWTTREVMRNTFETNVYGPTILTEALIPMLKKSSNARVINVSSSLGSIGIMTNHSHPHAGAVYPGYRMSKSALNMLTAYQYYHLKGDGVKVWSYCPGYVVTDLGNDREQRIEQGIESSETSAKGLLQIVQGERDADVGGFVTRYGEKYEW
jgi:NAD(P)-dependent dehydrogenase (short-subunit alcohol dehydrogenase family)